MNIIKFRIISSEVDGFVRDIEIEETRSFYELHLAIQAACEYDYSQMTCFYLSNKDWEKIREITLMQMDDVEREDNLSPLFMRETLLKDYCNETGKRFLYIFDFFSMRTMFLEVVNIRKKTGEDSNLEFPLCTLSKGKPPKPIKIDDMFMDSTAPDTSEYGDGYYNPLSDFDNIDDYDL